ncbi:MAG: ribonuclease J [Chloroflexota bacterium]
MAAPTIRIIPLGGIGEVGKNMLVVECGDDIIVIDAGLKFPEEEMLGVDLVIPDTSYLLENRHRVRGIIITHGHEDHVGALPYIVSDLDAPIYSTSLTRGLIAVKLREHRLVDEARLNLVEPGELLRLGAFTVEFMPVNHSIPDGVALVVDTPVGRLLHTGDFKFDSSPVGGQPTDLAKLAELGSRGVLALLSDCIRVERPGYTPSERVVGETFDAIMREATGRVIITTFASNISRIQQAIDVAHRYGRKVAVVGRSLASNLSVAKDLGYLQPPADTVLRLDQVRRLPHDKTVFITTGSQGEPTSVLSRIANDDHRQIRITSGDTVVLAATPVPGNEETVARTIDNLLRLGAEVVYEAVMTVHVSGHASREELRKMIQLVQPRFCMPLHGEYRHMVLYRKLAKETGVPAKNVMLASTGDVIEFTADSMAKVGTVPAGSVLVDGLKAGEIGEVVLRQRRQLARDGVVIAVVAFDRVTGQLVAGPDIVSRGFVEDETADWLMSEAREELRQAIGGSSRASLEPSYVTQKIKETLGIFLYRQTRRRPMILPVVTEV